MTTATSQFTITPASEDDAAAIGRVHFQSICETYPNEARGIIREWLQQRMAFLTEPKGDEYRRQTVRESKTSKDTLYLVVKNAQGSVCGFLHVTRGAQQAKLEAIYLTAEVRGQGVGQQLLERALAFAGDLLMELEVLDYNQRAMQLYQHNGFVIQPNSEHIVRDKLPVVTMIRPASKERA